MCDVRTIFVLLSALVVSTVASKCPEVRKPHVTSCTIFYNCINLPEGGYVWAPAKCSEGLVFQPYLRMCVLPGDAWTCDDSATEKFVLGHDPKSPQLTDPSLTSYHEYKQDFASPSANPATDDSAQLGNLRPLATAYPLIETMSAEDKKDTRPRDPTSQSGEQGADNYTYEFFASQHRLRTRLNSVSSLHDGKNDKFTWLRGIIDRILLYEDHEGTRQSCQLKNNRRDALEGNVLDYLVQSYVLGTRNPTGEKSRKRKNQPTTTRAWTGRREEADDRIPTTPTNFHQSAIDELINGPESENNVVVIEGNLGEREYVTIGKYKSLNRRIKLRALDILACAKGVRLPNVTDCTKYYTCDPETANVARFTCPPTTAFNDYNRVCDLQRYKACSRRDERLETTTQRASSIMTTLAPDGNEVAEHEPCRSTGKFVDAASDKRYYVCYSSQANPSKIESLRMTCPNDLIFCQDRRVCSTRKRCYDH